jgi:hypothetical protein
VLMTAHTKVFFPRSGVASDLDPPTQTALQPGSDGGMQWWKVDVRFVQAPASRCGDEVLDGPGLTV